MNIGDTSKSFNFRRQNESYMIQFFQVLFFTAAVVLIVLNVIQFNKYQEGKKAGATAHPIKWFNFVLTSIVALGCVLNILVEWFRKN